MKRKLNLELPKYRLQLHLRLIKRRKPLVDEPILPTREAVNKKYRTGTLLGKVGRYVSEHKSVRKILVGNFAAFAIITAFLPSAKTNVFAEEDNTVIKEQLSLVTEKGIQLPLGHLRINQNYGFFHPGIDLGASIGEAVKPVKAGVVTFAGYTSDGYGNLVVIEHNEDLESYYAHLSKIEVKTGELVTMETEIGKVGVTGHTTGPHLHLEIHQDGVAINPLLVLPR